MPRFNGLNVAFLAPRAVVADSGDDGSCSITVITIGLSLIVTRVTMSSVAHSPQSGEDGSLDEADVYEMLGNRRRRYALQYLRTCERPVAIGELAEHVAAMENDLSREEVTHEQRKSVYTALHQNHLPKLADTGLIRAEREWVGIELAPPVRDFDFELGVQSEDGARTDRYLFATVAVGLGLAVGFLLGVAQSSLALAGRYWMLIAALLVVVVVGGAVHRYAE
jgi:DNA-binding transcriptional ArsR family regulator